MAKKSSKSTSTSKPPRPAAKSKRTPGIVKEKHPESHDIKGKYTFLYVFFAICTLIFAFTTIYLYSFTHDVIRRYDNFVRYMQDNGNKQDNNYEGEE